MADTPGRVDALPIRLAEKIVEDPDTGCWNWTGQMYADGYGMLYVLGSGSGPARRYTRAHRVVHEALFGSIPPGLVMDHSCENRACVRPDPDHAEPCTQRENMRRHWERHPEKQAPRFRSKVVTV